MKNTVMTYYADISDVTSSTNNRDLLETWTKNWKAKGWHTIILTPEDAKLHKGIQTIDVYNNESLLVRNSRLNKKYLWNCYLRWFAYSKYVEENGTCVWSDFDVMNCNLSLEQLEKRNVLQDTAFDGSLCSGILSYEGSKTLTKNIALLHIEDTDVIEKINVFLNSKADKDLNDMIFLRALNVFKIYFICTGLRIKGMSPERLFFETDETYKTEAFPLIHFHHGIFHSPDHLNFPEVTSRNRTDIVKYFFKNYLNQPIF